MSVKTGFLFVVSLVTLLSVNIEGYCLAEDNNPYNLFSSKTGYDVVRGTAGSDSVCEAVQIWSFNRHGTRYASKSGLQEMKKGVEFLEKILDNYAQNLAPQNNRLCDKDLKTLSEWKWDESIENSGNDLTTEGWRELREMAQRYQRRYPELLSNYSDDQLYFRYSIEKRTEDSCKAFIEGLFGQNENVPVDDPMEEDPEIRPYKFCPAWSAEVDDDFQMAQEIVFKNGNDYQRLLSNISERLGFEENLKEENIENMYNLCRFESAWYPNEISPWCSVFKKREFFLLEYLEDLGYYYKSGYAHEYNPKLGCMPLKSLMSTFAESVKTESVKTKGIFLFGHNSMINMFMTALGYNKDNEPLMGSDYEDSMVSRLFRSSINTPFGANIAAVLYKCNGNDYQVQFFINERPMEIEGCPQGLCSWTYLSSKYSFAQSCNMDFCKIKE